MSTSNSERPTIESVRRIISADRSTVAPSAQLSVIRCAWATIVSAYQVMLAR